MQPYPQQPGYPAQPGYPQQYPPQQQAPGYPPAPAQPGQPYPQQAPTAPAPGQPRQFAKPEAAPSGDRVTATELANQLLIVVPVALHPNFYPPKAEVLNPDGSVKEAAKPAADAIEVNVVNLDGVGVDGQPGKTYIGPMWGGKVLANGLARQIGQEVLGRMVKGTAKGTNSAPFILNDESENPTAVGRANDFYLRRPNWQLEPGTDAVLKAGQPGAAQPGYPAQPMPQQQQYAQPYPQQQAPAYPAQPGYPAQPPMQGYPPAQPGPYGQPQQPVYGQPPAYQPGPVMQGSPEAAAAYGQLDQQQHPQNYQGQPYGYPQQ